MHGDFSRLTFRPDKHYRGVVAQQGRVQLDADANEQVAIDDYLLRTIVTDLVGPHAGPSGDPAAPGAPGFAIGYDTAGKLPDLVIGPGRYYVAGMLCDATAPEPMAPVNEDGQALEVVPPGDYRYFSQPDLFPDPTEDADKLPKPPFLVYLQVTERLVTALEDEDLAEPALGALRPDTTARLKVCWQVRALPADHLGKQPRDVSADELRIAFDGWAADRASFGRLAARTTPSTDTDPCVLAPDSQYRGPENQLYRVQVHRSGAAADAGVADPATFVWSRENGSVAFAVAAVAGELVTLAAPGRDGTLELEVGDWVEALDDVSVAAGGGAPLLQVLGVDVADRQVRLSGAPALAAPATGYHPRLRRWDQQAGGTGAPRLVDGALELTENRWLDLEDGIQVCFVGPGGYIGGDYWVIPARSAGGSLLWPENAARMPLAQRRLGPETVYAPLAWIRADGQVLDLRSAFAFLGLPL